MLKTLKSALQVEDIRKRLWYTFLMIVVVRIGSQIPVPGTNPDVVANIFANLQGDSFNLFNSMTGSSMEGFSILALSITPYITSSIIMQLLTIAIPKLEELQQDGTEGRKKIAEYTRYVTVALALVESIAMAIGFGNQGLFQTFDAFSVIVCVISLTAGSAFLMWVGERITENGIGNGISIVLIVNILSGMPEDFSVIWSTFVSGRSIAAGVVMLILIVAVILAIVAFVVWLNGASRNIPVQYAQKMQGRRNFGGQNSFIPLKVLTANVIPVIFASSILSIPGMIASFFTVDYTSVGGRILMLLNSSNWFSPNVDWWYSFGALIYIGLIIVFAYFYTSITFNPTEIAENMKKQGGFVPGIRPGKPTADYLNSVLNYVVFIGAIGLSIVAFVPIVIGGAFNIGRVSFLGTSMIIIVGVVLETLKQIEGRMVTREYDSIF